MSMKCGLELLSLRTWMCSPKIFILHGYPRSTFHKFVKTACYTHVGVLTLSFKLAQVTYQSKNTTSYEVVFLYKKLVFYFCNSDPVSTRTLSAIGCVSQLQIPKTIPRPNTTSTTPKMRINAGVPAVTQRSTKSIAPVKL